MSSGKKKRPPMVQCGGCQAFLLAKDLESHQQQLDVDQQKPNGGNHNSDQKRSTANPGNLLSATPKPQRMHSARLKQAAKSKQPMAAEGGDGGGGGGCCSKLGIQLSQLPMAKPDVGLALRRTAAFDSQSKAEVPGRIGFYGWQRRHTALVHPDVLDVVGASREAVFLVYEDNDQRYQQSTIITLWPSKEVPHLHVFLPPSQEDSMDYRSEPIIIRSRPGAQKTSLPPTSSLLRLHLIRSLGPPLSRLLLRPNDANNMTTAQYKFHRLAHVNYFPKLMRAYFANALILVDPTAVADPGHGYVGRLLEMFFYGRKLLFDIVDFGCCEDGGEKATAEGEEMMSLERKMLEACNVGKGQQPNDGEISVNPAKPVEVEEEPRVHSVSSHCQFDVLWPMEEEEQKGDDDLEGLL